MAKEMGLGVIPWSPLASGVLAGKYTQADLDHGGGKADPAGTRKNVAAANGSLTAEGLAIAEVVKGIAKELGKTPSQVAIAWTLLEPGVTAPILGARTLKQLEDNFGALDVELTESHRARLEEASAIDLGFPHDFLKRPMVQQVVFGGTKLEARH